MTEPHRARSPNRPAAGPDICFLALLLLIGVAAALRFYGLGRFGLWGDEAVSWYQSGGSLMDTLGHTTLDNYPPLHNLILNFTQRFLGDSEVALRLPSAILGTLAVWQIFRLGAGLWDRTTGLLAAGMMTVCGFFVWYSQEARMYALLICTAMYFVSTMLQAMASPSRKNLAFNALAATLLLYSHVYGSFIFAGVNLFVFTALKRGGVWPNATPRDWITAQSVAAILYSPWAGGMLLKASKLHGWGFWIEDLSPSFVAEQLHRITGGWTLLIVLAVLCLVAVLNLPPRARGENNAEVRGRHSGRLAAALAVDWRSGLVLSWLFSSLVCGVLVSLAIDQNVLYYRYLAGSYPAVLLLAAFGLRKLNSNKLVFFTAMAITLASFGPDLVYKANNPTRSRVRELVADMEQRLQPGDQVFAFVGWKGYLFEYYLRGIDNDYYIELDPREVARRAPSFERFWILDAKWVRRKTRKAREQLDLTHEVIYSSELWDSEALLFQRKSPDPEK